MGSSFIKVTGRDWNISYLSFVFLLIEMTVAILAMSDNLYDTVLRAITNAVDRKF